MMWGASSEPRRVRHTHLMRKTTVPRLVLCRGGQQPAPAASRRKRLFSATLRLVRITVRAGGSGDWPAMCRTFAQAGQAGWSHIVPAPILADLSASEGWHPANGADVLVAEVDGNPEGFAVICVSQDADATGEVGEIDAFYTHPSVWGSGVGRALMSAAVKRLGELGFQEATLWTEHRNFRPRRFSALAGWEPVGAEPRRGGRDNALPGGPLCRSGPPSPPRRGNG